MSYGSNSRAPISEKALQVISANKAPLPSNSDNSPYPADKNDHIHTSVYEHTLAFVDTKNPAGRGDSRGTVGALTDVAGQFGDAESFDEIEDRVRVLGPVRQNAVDSERVFKPHYSVAVAGQISVKNTGSETIPAGSLVRAVVPRGDERDSFKNNPRDPGYRPLDRFPSADGMPRGKAFLQTVPVRKHDHVSPESVLAVVEGKNGSRAAREMKDALHRDTELGAIYTLYRAQEAGLIDINVVDANDDDAEKYRKIAKLVSRDRNVEGETLTMAVLRAKLARKPKDLVFKTKNFSGQMSALKRSITNDQISGASMLLAGFSSAVRQQDHNVIGMTHETAKPGELMHMSVSTIKNI